MFYGFSKSSLCLGFGICLAVGAVAQESAGDGKVTVETAAAAKLAAAELDCVRFVEAGGKARLETVVRTLVSPAGQTVDLVGVVHIADAAYYADLNKRLATYEAVLYEMVGKEEDMKKANEVKAAGGEPNESAEGPTEKPNMLRNLQKMVGTMLRLKFQLDEIDYAKANFVHADMSADEFASEMAKRGESFMSMFSKAMQAQQEGKNSMSKGLEELENMDSSAMLMMLLSGSGSDPLKVVLAKAFHESEAMLADISGSEGSTIIEGRNAKALAKLKEVLATGKKKVSVFYGAGHLPGMQAELTKQGWKVTGEAWLPAWSMAVKPAPANETETEKK